MEFIMITTTNSRESISLNELIPAKSNYGQKIDKKSLQTVIRTHIGVIGLTIAAIKSFQQGDIPDPLVGENACQIRAAYYSAQAADASVMSALSEICPKLEGLIERISKVKLPVGKEVASMDEIIQENDLDVKVPPAVAPIVFGHILTISKESDLSIRKESEASLPKLALKEGNDPKKLKGLSTGAARELIKHARRSLSEWSVQYLQDEAERYCMKGPEGILTDSMGLKSAPASPGMEILLTSMKVHRTAIVLKNRIIDSDGNVRGQVTLLCKPDGKNRSYQVVKVPKEEDLNCPGMIIEAVTISSKQRTEEELAAEIIEVGIEPIIYANFAAHPQYGGGCKTVEPPKCEERERWLQVAREKGLCAENPDLCRMYHIYAAPVGKHLSVGGSK